jgi:Mrp family chromosome partitioning ATPase
VAQPESSRLELVMDADFTADPTPEAEPEQPRSTSLTLTGVGPVVTTAEWSPRVLVLEEVELQAELDPRLVLLAAPSSPRARGYRSLQHRLVADSDPRVIAVTSAAPGEGKTTCAANLALALAEQSFSRVLLIDANVRRPGLAALFGFEPEDSFIARITSDHRTAPPYLVASVRGTRLHVAALHPNAPDNKRLDRLLLDMAISELRYCYDYIVLDAASVSESADADVVGECADAVVLAARARHTRKRALQRAVEQLKPTAVLGVVLLDA